jgi:hypothetical protein
VASGASDYLRTTDDAGGASGTESSATAPEIASAACRNLVKNNLVLDLKQTDAVVHLFGRAAAELEKNNLACPSCRFFSRLHSGRSPAPRLEENNVLVEPQPSPYNGDPPMLRPEQIKEIHLLHWAEKWALRKIARQTPHQVPHHCQILPGILTRSGSDGVTPDGV